LAKIGIFCHLFTFKAVMKNGCHWNWFRYVLYLALPGVVSLFLSDALKASLSSLSVEKHEKIIFSFAFRSLICIFNVR
jgi:hypothetical protein